MTIKLKKNNYGEWTVFDGRDEIVRMIESLDNHPYALIHWPGGNSTVVGRVFAYCETVSEGLAIVADLFGLPVPKEK